MNYRYRAMTQDGQKLQGIIDANDERQARLRLREEGLFLLDIRPQKSSGVKTRRPRISHSELTLFTRQLATLSAAQMYRNACGYRRKNRGSKADITGYNRCGRCSFTE